MMFLFLIRIVSLFSCSLSYSVDFVLLLVVAMMKTVVLLHETKLKTQTSKQF